MPHINKPCSLAISILTACFFKKQTKDNILVVCGHGGGVEGLLTLLTVVLYEAAVQ